MARIAGINIPQNKLVQIGLTYIYGIGNKFSKRICSSLEIPKDKRVNQLTDDEKLVSHSDVNVVQHETLDEIIEHLADAQIIGDIPVEVEF